MIPARIAIPPPPNRTKSRVEPRRSIPGKAASRGIAPKPSRNVAGIADVKRRNWHTGSEERNIVAVIALMFLMLILPAALMLVYIFVNPDAFQFNDPSLPR